MSAVERRRRNGSMNEGPRGHDHAAAQLDVGEHLLDRIDVLAVVVLVADLEEPGVGEADLGELLVELDRRAVPPEVRLLGLSSVEAEQIDGPTERRGQGQHQHRHDVRVRPDREVASEVVVLRPRDGTEPGAHDPVLEVRQAVAQQRCVSLDRHDGEVVPHGGPAERALELVGVRRRTEMEDRVRERDDVGCDVVDQGVVEDRRVADDPDPVRHVDLEGVRGRWARCDEVRL